VIHLNLGTEISYIKFWNGEEWTLKELKLVAAGGN